LTTVIAGDWMAVMVASDGAETTGGPDGGSPWAVAWLVTDPASTSAAVVRLGAVQVCDARPPGWSAGS